MSYPRLLLCAAFVGSSSSLFAQAQQARPPRFPVPPTQVLSIGARGDSILSADRNLVAFATTVDRLITAGSPPTLDERHTAGKSALAALITNLSALGGYYSAMLIEQGFNGGTNLWSDADIRGGWDTFQSFASAGGAALAGVALLSSRDSLTKSNRFFAGVGVGTVSVLQLVNAIRGSKLGDKLEYAEFSRRAWDDLRVRTEMTAGLKAKNDSLAAAMTRFKTDTYERAASDADKRTTLVGLISYADAVDLAIEDLLRLVTFDDEMINRYISIDASGNVLSKVGKLNAEAAQHLKETKLAISDLLKRYTFIKSALSLNADLRATVLGF